MRVLTAEQVKAIRVSLGLNRKGFAHTLGVHHQRVVLSETVWPAPGDPFISERIAIVYGRRRAHLTLIQGGRV